MRKVIDFVKWVGLFFRMKDKYGTQVDITYPVSWESMSYSEFESVCSVLDGEPRNEPETLFLCLCALARIRPAAVKYDTSAIGDRLVMAIGDRLYVVSPEVIQAACHQLSYIIHDVGLSPSPLLHVDRKLYGVTFGQFYEADSLILRYNATKKDRYLDDAARVLTGKKAFVLSGWKRRGLVIWWSGVKKYLMNKYPHVFQSSDEGGGAVGGEKTPADILQELLSAMNGNHPQENDRILATELHSVLFSLDRIYQQNAKKSR